MPGSDTSKLSLNPKPKPSQANLPNHNSSPQELRGISAESAKKLMGLATEWEEALTQTLTLTLI